MTENDVSAVTVALNKHLNDNYKVHITFSESEVHHFLLPKQNVVWSYVVDDTDGNVTDFISFYALNSQILDNEQYSHIYAAYAFYNFAKDNNTDRMKALI